jgi:hypothetical protein
MAEKKSKEEEKMLGMLEQVKAEQRAQSLIVLPEIMSLLFIS